MKYVLFFFIIMLLSSCQTTFQMSKKNPPIAIAVHGGASNITSMNLSSEQEQAYQAGISAALDSGYLVLKNGGTSVDAVTAAVKVLEDNPLFNAGKGAVFTSDGKNEMDAAIMDGATRDCGAVAGVHTIKNPIEAARMVMLKSGFILLSGKGAEEFATKKGIEIVDTSYFFTPFRWEQLQKAQEKDSVSLDNESLRGSINPIDENKVDKFGTVGCVAIDKNGNLAAATSTGGLVNKKYNRIGDSPLIGAGTFADNATCAVSCTGKGEDFIRLVVAHDISALMRYKHYSLRKASKKVIIEKLTAIKGRGGCIAVDKRGRIAMPFNTTGMFRGSIDKKGLKTVAIYANKPLR